MLGIKTIASLGKSVVNGVRNHFADKRELKKAKVDAKINRLRSAQQHDQKWELRQMENSGWQDEVLFLFFIGLFVLAGVAPEHAREFFENLNVLPDWFVKTWMWIVASVVGVKKIGDYGPKLAKEGIDAIKGR